MDLFISVDNFDRSKLDTDADLERRLHEQIGAALASAGVEPGVVKVQQVGGPALLEQAAQRQHDESLVRELGHDSADMLTSALQYQLKSVGCVRGSGPLHVSGVKVVPRAPPATSLQGFLDSTSNAFGSMSVSVASAVRHQMGLPQAESSGGHLPPMAPPVATSGPMASEDVAVIIFALDYENTDRPMSGSVDGRHMEDLARASGITNVKSHYNEQCTKEVLLLSIQSFGQECKAGDTLLFYYTGLAWSVYDKGREDEAYCYVDAAGQIDKDTCLTDSSFCQMLCQWIPDNVNLIVLTDCCHDQIVYDITRPCWTNQAVVSLSGCVGKNDVFSARSRSGVVTQSLLMAIESMQEQGRDAYTISELYDCAVAKCGKTFAGVQQIKIGSRLSAERRRWPLVPQYRYQAPSVKHALASFVSSHER